MHEVGLVEGIVDTVRRRAGDRPVARVKVQIGTLHRASQGPMEQAFEMVGAGTIVDGATLELIQMPVTSTCRECGRVEAGDEIVLLCQSCGAISLVYAGGDELILESIEYREPAVGAASSATG
jgi:hydrogenase nickel incorporation protein HypA/HybF